MRQVLPYLCTMFASIAVTFAILDYREKERDQCDPAAVAAMQPRGDAKWTDVGWAFGRSLIRIELDGKSYLVLDSYGSLLLLEKSECLKR